MDTQGVGSLKLDAFRKGLQVLGLHLEDSETALVFKHFDTNRSGTIDFDEFHQGVRDPLSRHGRAQLEERIKGARPTSGALHLEDEPKDESRGGSDDPASNAQTNASSEVGTKNSRAARAVTGATKTAYQESR